MLFICVGFLGPQKLLIFDGDQKFTEKFLTCSGIKTSKLRPQSKECGFNS